MISPLLGVFLYGKHRFLHISDGITRITSNGDMYDMNHIPDYIVGYFMLLIPLFNVHNNNDNNKYIYIFIYLFVYVPIYFIFAIISPLYLVIF